MAATRYLRTDYNVAWICPLPDVELLPARLMLDERHDPPSIDTTYDDNTYICGMIKGHRVVIATLPKGLTGNVNASRLTGPLFKSFPNIKIALLVGIGGGVPRSEPSNDPLEDIHLGDVVVGWPGDGKPGVIYHEQGRAMVNDEFEIVGTTDKPEWRLVQALGVLSLNQEMEETTFPEQVSRLQGKPKFAMPDLKHDRLFQASYCHIGDKGSSCKSCDLTQIVQRPTRMDEQRGAFVFHQGRIATGNSVVRDGELRDKISKQCGGVLCVEMEAAGVDINGRCLVIRGISDYADSHKNDMWKQYAAGNAAAFARELLCTMQASTVRDMEGTVQGKLEASIIIRSQK